MVNDRDIFQVSHMGIWPEGRFREPGGINCHLINLKETSVHQLYPYGSFHFLEILPLRCCPIATVDHQFCHINHWIYASVCHFWKHRPVQLFTCPPPTPFCMWLPENMDQRSLASLYMLRVEAGSCYCCSLVLPWYSFSLKIVLSEIHWFP